MPRVLPCSVSSEQDTDRSAGARHFSPALLPARLTAGVWHTVKGAEALRVTAQAPSLGQLASAVLSQGPEGRKGPRRAALLPNLPHSPSSPACAPSTGMTALKSGHLQAPAQNAACCGSAGFGVLNPVASQHGRCPPGAAVTQELRGRTQDSCRLDGRAHGCFAKEQRARGNRA